MRVYTPPQIRNRRLRENYIIGTSVLAARRVNYISGEDIDTCTPLFSSKLQIVILNRYNALNYSLR